MNTVLLIALLALAFIALLKIADTFRDLAFEIRQTRFEIENQTKAIEALHSKWWAWARTDPAVRAEENRRSSAPTVEEIMENLG